MHGPPASTDDPVLSRRSTRTKRAAKERGNDAALRASEAASNSKISITAHPAHVTGVGRWRCCSSNSHTIRHGFQTQPNIRPRAICNRPRARRAPRVSIASSNIHPDWPAASTAHRHGHWSGCVRRPAAACDLQLRSTVPAFIFGGWQAIAALYVELWSQLRSGLASRNGGESRKTQKQHGAVE